MPKLFTIDTDQVTVSWSQRKEKPPPVVPEHTAPPYGLVVQALASTGAPHVRCFEGDGHLFEQREYTLLVQSKTSASIRVRHQDPVLLQGLQRSDDGRVIHGTLNFGTQVGYSRFAIEVGGLPHAAFEVEVFPSKLDYRRDYEALREEVQEIATELVLDYLRATYQEGGAEPHEPGGTGAWVYWLRHLINDLEQALAYIARQPQWGTRRVVEARRADRVRRPDAVLRRAVQRGIGEGGWGYLVDPQVPIREHLPGACGRYTLDTPAHRWLATRLASLQVRLAEVRAAEARRHPSRRGQHLLADLDALQHRLRHVRQFEVLRKAEGTPPEEPPFPLFTAPGYREAYHACVQLQQGLHFEGGPLHLGLRDLHLLYEYWCYLTLLRLIAALTGALAPLRRLIGIEQDGVRLRLRKGRAQTVTFPLPAGCRIEVTYNPRFGGKGYLVPQQPDLLLAVHHPGGPVNRYVLDAKYRLDASASYRQRYGLPGPPSDALNTLHRYRDAIRDPGLRGEQAYRVRQAIALFPYREEIPGLFEQSRNHRMIREIGLGALPLLPGETSYVRTWVEAILAPCLQT